MQAIALWHTAFAQWLQKKGGSPEKKKRRGATINRKDLVFLPAMEMNSLWHYQSIGVKNRNKIQLTVHGREEENEEWSCGLEINYYNKESFYCRPLDKSPFIPEAAKKLNVVLLPPMSGLVNEEPLLEQRRINALLGQGRTAEILRNICYALREKDKQRWEYLCEHIKTLFGADLKDPLIHPGTGLVEISYAETRPDHERKQGRSKQVTYDIQSAGHGMQQVMLLLAFLYFNGEGTVLLMDEPDAHLEILQQAEVYKMFREIADSQRSQIIVASHSEKLLNDAARNEAAVSFVGSNPQKLGQRISC